MLALKTPLLFPKNLALRDETSWISFLYDAATWIIRDRNVRESSCILFFVTVVLLVFLHPTLEKLRFPGAFWCNYVSGTRGSSVTGFELGMS